MNSENNTQNNNQGSAVAVNTVPINNGPVQNGQPLTQNVPMQNQSVQVQQPINNVVQTQPKVVTPQVNQPVGVATQANAKPQFGTANINQVTQQPIQNAVQQPVQPPIQQPVQQPIQQVTQQPVQQTGVQASAPQTPITNSVPLQNGIGESTSNIDDINSAKVNFVSEGTKLKKKMNPTLKGIITSAIVAIVVLLGYFVVYPFKKRFPNHKISNNE